MAKSYFYAVYLHPTMIVFLISLYRCLEWLLNNLMTHQNVDLMKELGYVCSTHSSLVLISFLEVTPDNKGIKSNFILA